ncbi:ankyrin repeat-containing domain protein [Aspergillus caelatus]|uniref:Ankyrin repeat-containing domain protein n=1 Tax=Aspergillus caelatus TaxID=61420 RepID=A0A5N6ZSB6_9EURO|nr:ankyrin repeat-containing domain protein [Aspergillus caelatus]KAE8360285.1 ankyrin repeat-containing domain protein [Aspergillus caelatus]
MGSSTHSISIMEDRLALERRRERNRLAQRKHRENAKLRRPRQANSDKTLPEQNSQPGQARCTRSSGSNSQECPPFSAFLGPALDYNIDHLSAENFFPDVVFSPHVNEYSRMDLASSTAPLDQQQQLELSPFTVDTIFQTSPNKCNGVGSRTWTTPLHISVSRGHLTAVRLLLDGGADPNAIDGEGSTVLHTAVRSSHHIIVRELLRHGADPSAVDAAGWLPLHYAAEAGDENCLRVLLQPGGE